MASCPRRFLSSRHAGHGIPHSWRQGLILGVKRGFVSKAILVVPPCRAWHSSDWRHGLILGLRVFVCCDTCFASNVGCSDAAGAGTSSHHSPSICDVVTVPCLTTRTPRLRHSKVVTPSSIPSTFACVPFWCLLDVS